jgi:hypothetical protein
VRRKPVRVLQLLVQHCRTNYQQAFGTSMRPEPAPGGANEGNRRTTVPECRTWRIVGVGVRARAASIGRGAAWRGGCRAVALKNIYFLINSWSGLFQNGSAKVAQVAPMCAHAAVRLPGGLTDPCHGVGSRGECRGKWGHSKAHRKQIESKSRRRPLVMTSVART